MHFLIEAERYIASKYRHLECWQSGWLIWFDYSAHVCCGHDFSVSNLGLYSLLITKPVKDQFLQPSKYRRTFAKFLKQGLYRILQLLVIFRASISPLSSLKTSSWRWGLSLPRASWPSHSTDCKNKMKIISYTEIFIHVDCILLWYTRWFPKLECKSAKQILWLPLKVSSHTVATEKQFHKCPFLLAHLIVQTKMKKAV